MTTRTTPKLLSNGHNQGRARQQQQQQQQQQKPRKVPPDNNTERATTQNTSGKHQKTKPTTRCHQRRRNGHQADSLTDWAGPRDTSQQRRRTRSRRKQSKPERERRAKERASEKGSKNTTNRRHSLCLFVGRTKHVHVRDNSPTITTRWRTSTVSKQEQHKQARTITL